MLRKKQSAKDLIESFTEQERIAITVISKYEILRGTTERDTDLVSGLLNQFVIYDFNDSVVREAAKVHKKLAEKGKMINELDILIAGIAVANNETLITRDKNFLNLESTKIVVL